MAEKQILQLPKTQFSGLEFSNILEDVYNLVKENPNYNENWDDFLSSNAGVMITEIFAWIADQLATRIDWVVNENFIGTATQRGSIINLLKLIGYKFKLPSSAEVPVEIKFENATGEYVLTKAYDPAIGTFEPKTISAKDKKGNTKFFEAVFFDPITLKFIYDKEISIDTDVNLVNSIDFYEGQTKIETFVSSKNQGQIFTLSESPVVRDSIFVALVTRDGEVINEDPLLEVDNFLSLKAQKLTNADGTENAIPYVINVLENDIVEIEFGSSSLISSQGRRLTEGSELKIFYRIGGGVDGDISRHAINLTEDITNNLIKTTVTYLNKTEGVGSENSETIEHAAYSGPLQIKTAGKTVTEEDYDIILSSFVGVLLSKAYGHNNLPNDFYDKYGIYISPLEVLNFVIMKKSGWEEIPTSKYKYANWGTFNLENYFNEKITFSDGVFGNPLSLNNNTILNLGEDYDYNNQGGRTFKNFIVISTPQAWKEQIFIEDPNDPNEYIANPELKASLTTVDYNDGNYNLLEEITDHFIVDNDNDPFFYGDFNNTGTPKQEITEDINAYFQSKKDVTDGVYVGVDEGANSNPDQINLNIDGHGNVPIDLSEGRQYTGVIPLGDNSTPHTVIHTINSSLAAAYNDVFSYHDFGVLVEDRTAVVSSLEGLDEQLWTLKIDDSSVDILNLVNPFSFDISTGFDQSYESMLGHMNNAFGHGYQEFEHTDNWVTTTAVDSTEYELRISVDGAANVNIILPPISGNTMYIEDDGVGGNGLTELLNLSFEENNIEAIATIVYDEDPTQLGRLVRVTSKSTDADSSILITAGDSNSLLGITSAPKTAVDDTTAGYGFIASFVQSSANIACHDIRISRTSSTGSVLLLDSGTTTDILTAYGALPITTEPVIWGDYSNVASVVVDGLEKFILLTSPNSGPNAGIIISPSSLSDPGAGVNRDATIATFGLDYSLDGVEYYECFGQRKLTIIFRDTEDDDFGDFIYEHGSIHFNNTSPNVDIPQIWLNYIASKTDTVKLGSYYTDNFENTDPEWKLPAHRIYNTIYEDDSENPIPNSEKINYNVSNFLIEFTKNEVVNNSIYTINEENSGNTKLELTLTDYPTITSIDLSSFPATADKFIKISINENDYISKELDLISNIPEFVTLLNNTWLEQANEIENKGILFATQEGNTVVLKIDNKKGTGKIVIHDDITGDKLGSTFFNTNLYEDTIIYPSGDYYLEHYVQPQTEDPDIRTEEEKFGHFNLKIIPNSSVNIPDLSFYAHFVNDRRHKFKIPETYRITTDEDNLVELLKPYKIAGVDNSFKRPVFSTFDCKAVVYIESSASKEQVKQTVKTALENFYSLENTILSENVNKSEFIGIVLKVAGVRYIDITYFGQDAENETENENIEIVSDFDEILVLSDNVFDDSGKQTHGLIFQYNTL